MSRLNRIPPRQRLLVLTLVVVAALGVATLLPQGPRSRTATAYFTSATGLNVGDAVVVLGMRVGTIRAITPEPGQARVVFDYRLDHALPAQVHAMISSPSVVPVRTLVLGPLHGRGELADGATIPLARTAVPVEWDQVKEQITRLAAALGPNGANRHGALGRLVQVGADNLRANGPALNDTIRQLSRAMRVLADNKGNLFQTVANLRIFVDALSSSDAQVGEFNHRLADTAAILAGNSQNLGRALDGMDTAVVQLRSFLQRNRPASRAALRNLAPVLHTLAANRQQIADLLHVAPTSLTNLYNIYEPLDGAISAAPVGPMQALGPAAWVCSALYAAGATPADCAKAIAPLVQLATFAPPPVGASLVERNGRSNQVTPGGAGR